jgi:hypothetical protein
VNVQGAFPAAPQTASSFVYEPMTENILSLTFDYFDANGARLNTYTPGHPLDDIGGGEEGRQARARVRPGGPGIFASSS